MTSTQPAMKMPEFLIFARSLLVGFLCAEAWRSGFYLGANFATELSDVAVWLKALVMTITIALCLVYAHGRDAFVVTIKIVRSFRIDLLLAVGIGIWINELAAPLLSAPHEALKSMEPNGIPVVFLTLCALLFSPIYQRYRPKPKKKASQLFFMTDDEIDCREEDLLKNTPLAKSFAETVLASDSHSRLVFGLDGPWGTGKTSFINLAQHHWEQENNRVIVCRFEPLRYASEPNLTERLIRDLSNAIQKEVFAPDFKPTASRYSRMIKGKADLSFLGFKLSMSPSTETVDELLEDIDDVLRRINRRVIIIIDDLDRLDAKAVNNVLFATKRAFNLSQATYILCYDTECLSTGHEDESKARDFLEKFVTVKQSLFVDSSSIRDFLLRDWQHAENSVVSIPADTMMKLGAVISELSNILADELAANYLPLVGNLRKVKRFVNAMLIMQIDRSDLGRTDFNKSDLINLILLHLNYPGLFRRIYDEETDGRSGSFSVSREFGEDEFKNSKSFQDLVDNDQLQAPAVFLLKQLFDVRVLELGVTNHIEEETLSSRACFNHEQRRNLEGYLKLIVRLSTPKPQKTFILYQQAVERVKKGASIIDELNSSDLQLTNGEDTHDQFWRVLINQSYDLTSTVAQNTIDTLVDYIPRYSMIENPNQGLRKRSIYSLIMLLDRAGWGRTGGTRKPNTPENIIEIADRIFGENAFQGNSLLERLASDERGVLGWNDLMIFRLLCSADRQGQLHNLHSSLILHHNIKAETTGSTHALALVGMRKLSQEVFALFKRTYIDKKRNFITEIYQTPNELFFGKSDSKHSQQQVSANNATRSGMQIDQMTATARSTVSIFIIYQLSNCEQPKGSGVGCGYYDESGDGDNCGIAKQMNDYMFNLCFNPAIDKKNTVYFLDFCLSRLSSPFETNKNEYSATKYGLTGGLDPVRLGKYWVENKGLLRQQAKQLRGRCVFTTNYKATYEEDLEGIFIVLTELANEHNNNTSEPV